MPHSISKSQTFVSTDLGRTSESKSLFDQARLEIADHTKTSLTKMAPDPDMVTVYQDSPMMELAWPKFLKDSYASWLSFIHSIEADQRKRRQRCQRIEEDSDSGTCEEEQKYLKRTWAQIKFYDDVLSELLMPGGLELRIGEEGDVECVWKFARFGPLAPSKEIADLGYRYPELRKDPSFVRYRRDVADIFRSIRRELPAWDSRRLKLTERCMDLTDKLPPFQSKLTILEIAKDVALANGVNRGFEVEKEWTEGQDYDLEIEDAQAEMKRIWTEAWNNAYHCQVYAQVEVFLFDNHAGLKEAVEDQRKHGGFI